MGAKGEVQVKSRWLGSRVKNGCRRFEGRKKCWQDGEVAGKMEEAAAILWRGAEGPGVRQRCRARHRFNNPEVLANSE